MVRWLFVIFLMFTSQQLLAARCGTLDVTYGVFSNGDLKIERSVTINGNLVTEDDYSGEGIETDGDVVAANPSFPSLEPSSFPDNSASTDLDEDDSPLDGSAEVFYDKIKIDDDETYSFTGAGPFHIDELKIENGATVNFSAGVCYIRKMEAKDDSVVNFEYPTRIFTNDEVKVKKRAKFNELGEPHDVIVFVYDNAKFETDDDAVVVATNWER